ncbi:MAG: hypothetical protein DRI24_12855 [Deltaproteobacteria bacterium]|nr:MAG: hypothetical protein DRI24_12855 [Deltaproteobacteria bacterium]
MSFQLNAAGQTKYYASIFFDYPVFWYAAGFPWMERKQKMARPNFQFKKRQKEIARMKKKEEKRQRKIDKKNPGDIQDHSQASDE